MSSTYSFNQLAIIDQHRLVLDIAGRRPRLDLVPKALQFLDFFFEFGLQLVLLGLRRCLVDLVEDALKHFDALGYFLERPLDFCLQLPA